MSRAAWGPPIYLRHAAIDKERWDACIASAPNGNIYGLSWVLDCHGEWDALVDRHYSYCFPLFHNNKYLFFKQLYQPAFAQQHGLFANAPLERDVLQSFLNEIYKYFKKININLNEGNIFMDVPMQMRTNYLLSLSPSYETLHAGYARRQKNNLRKAKKHYAKVGIGEPDALISLFQTQIGERIKLRNFTALRKMMAACAARGQGRVLEVRDAQGCIGAMGFFPESQGRIYNLFSVSTEEGRRQSAMHFLLDWVIKTNCEQDKTLDFEGSNIPSIASFFAAFGAEKHFYPNVQKKAFFVL
jgi:hypothetical protein